MCVHWYSAEHFLELSYRWCSKSKGPIYDELRVSFKNRNVINLSFSRNYYQHQATKVDKIYDV